MIDDKRLRDVKKWLEKCDSPYEMEYAYYALEALEELQTLREQNVKREIYVANMITISGEMAQENKALIEDAERLAKELYLIDSWNLDSFSNEDVERIFQALKKHNDLVREIK